MAKARASATPAKASRKASPAKSKAASPAPATRSSPRRAAPSAKAQEATDDRVQTGRVTKKTSPSKAATPAKKASPAKAATEKASPAKAKAASPAKEKQSPVKPSLASPKKVGEKKVPTHPEQDPAEAKQFLKTHGYVEHYLAWYVRTHDSIEYLESSPTVSQRELQNLYEMLLEYKLSVGGNARETDDQQTRQTKPIYRKLKKAMIKLLGSNVNECLKQDIDKRAFLCSLIVDLTLNDHHKDEVPRDLIPQIRMRHAYSGRGSLAGLSKQSILRRERMIADGSFYNNPGVGDPAWQEWVNTCVCKDFDPDEPANSSRARSKSPAKAPAAKRAASQSPAPIKNSKTRSNSPRKASVESGPENETMLERAERILESEWASEASKRHARTLLKSERASQKASTSARAASRSKSPAKVSSRPASTKTRQTRSRSKSPAEAEAAYRPAADDEDDEEDMSDEDDEPKASPQKKTTKPGTKRSASTSRKSPSPPKKPRTTSPTKPKTTTKPKRSPSPAPSPAPSPKPTPRARSKSPIKPPASSPRKTSTTSPSKKPTTNPYPRPHPSQPARGTVISPTNPQTIQQLHHKPNPFHETLPAPEVWHRRLPPYFPFGETPYMEKIAGEVIEEDLKRGAEDRLARSSDPTHPSNNTTGLISRVTSLASSAADAVRSTFTSPPKVPARKRYPGMWDLPAVYDADARKASASTSTRQQRERERVRAYGGYRDVGGLEVGSSEEEEEEQEEEDEDDEGDEYMSGGLH